MKIKITLFCLAFFLSEILVYGQSPQLMNYQAVVRDSHGNPEPASTPVALTFIIHADSAAGTVVYTETQNVTTNALGFVNVEIGRVTSLSGLNWGNGAMYLEVQANINSTGNVSMGNSQLISVPYALYAANSNLGPIGPTGVAGVTGATGPSGNNGADGATGSTGPAGNTGTTGAIGPGGNDGNNGATGATGPSGNDGNNGATGATGPSGNDGNNGATGATGPSGNDGNNGATGATGPSGQDGNTGATGPTGLLANGTALGNTTYWDGTQWVVNSGFLYNDGTAVGIGGVPTGSYTLQVFGRLKTNGFNETSDARLKKNINTIGNALPMVMQLRGVNYNWKTQGELDKENIATKSAADVNNINKPEIGLIAQEVEKVLPAVVFTDNYGFKSVEYSKLVALLIEAMKEQQATIEQLKAQNKTNEESYKLLENENREMHASIKAIQEAIGITSVK